jgi:hypothetical protein
METGQHSGSAVMQPQNELPLGTTARDRESPLMTPHVCIDGEEARQGLQGECRARLRCVSCMMGTEGNFFSTSRQPLKSVCILAKRSPHSER